MNRLLTITKTYLNDFTGLLYPELCCACNSNLVNQETVLCTRCEYELPRTHFHKVMGNPVEQTFWGRVVIERATSFFFFLKGSRYRKLLHQLKYKGRKDIGIELGRLFGKDLSSEPAFTEIDLIIPVPLHPRKERIRGYNQSEMIAIGLAHFLPGKVDTQSLYRKTFTETQTKKSRFERWENVGEVFGVREPEKLDGKHILLVDDVLTTGATLEACASVLHAATNVKISIATLAYASV